MKINRCQTSLFTIGFIGYIVLSGFQKETVYMKENHLIVNDSDYFETRGLNYFVFSNIYDATFDDSKISAVEIIHHGIRTATNGDVRLNPTPGQWDKLPRFIDRKVDQKNKRIEVSLSYLEYAFDYKLVAEAKDGGLYLSVYTEKALPDKLCGIAGLNLEFVPPVFWGHSYILDDIHGLFPTSPADFMTTIQGIVEPEPIATGRKIEIAPDDPEKHVSIRTTDGNTLMLFDGRNKQQNGNFVVRTLLPGKKTGKIAEWFIQAETDTQWIRKPLVAYSQVGYHPAQKKMAVIELDKNDEVLHEVTLLKVGSDGRLTKVLSAMPADWGIYTRYKYKQFDFTAINEPGIYVLEYDKQRTAPFPIGKNVFQKAWFPTLDVFFPVQMDHMCVREAYRIWHGAPHLDDALQAPLNRNHWDGWHQGPTTDNKYKPLEHIEGLNVGGWFDAGDFDIQTPSQQSVVQTFADLWSDFRVSRDQTSINQQTRYTEIHVPDGKPDLLQQLEHGVLQLIGQVNAVGYAIPGITESHLYQYRHLGDAVNKTDNKVYNANLDSLQTDGPTSGTFDDRWAFTNRNPYLNYGTAISLAAAARCLKEYNPQLSMEASRVAQFIWKDEHSRPTPEKIEFGGRSFNSADFMNSVECRAAFELWRTVGDTVYKNRMQKLFPVLLTQFDRNVSVIARILPFLDNQIKKQVEPMVQTYVKQVTEQNKENPFGVQISRFSWAGNHGIVQEAINAYQLHLLYPDIVKPDLIYRSLDYLFGCHPFHNLSFVSGVGAQPKKVAYGNNRADYSFIPGGVVPGIRIVKPDFPENRDDYPFLWSENEYVIDLAASYIYLVNAADHLLNNSGK